MRLTASFPPRFNIAPTQEVAAVLDEAPDVLTRLRWGLIPSWATDPKIASSRINARCETVATKPAFRTAFKYRRCLVAADGFYEWQKVGPGNVPYDICLRADEPFAFAGLWEVWRNPEQLDAEPLRTCLIITTAANAAVAPIHNRMPVILPPESYAAWLDPRSSEAVRLSLLAPYPEKEMRTRPISSRVNSPRFNDPTILDSFAAPAPAVQGDLFNSA